MPDPVLPSGVVHVSVDENRPLWSMAELEWIRSNPECGAARYGKPERYGTSGPSTPSPRALFGEMLKPSTRTPATTRSAMSTVSSWTRRPLGYPALSPAMTPRRLMEPTGVTGMAVFRRS